MAKEAVSLVTSFSTSSTASGRDGKVGLLKDRVGLASGICVKIVTNELHDCLGISMGIGKIDRSREFTRGLL